MTLTRLVLRGMAYHWRTNLAVVLGVAAATAVLAGALVVGESVRGSLRDIALGRLGRTDAVVSSTGFFRASLADDLRAAVPGAGAVPLIVANGFITHEPSRRRAANVLVYGVDERFWSFHGLPAANGVYLSPALAAELGAAPGDALLTRVQKPAQIPIESLFGRKEDIGRTLRLQLDGVLPPARLGEFALQPQQSEIRAIFAPLSGVARDLGVRGEVNTVLLSGQAVDPARLAGGLGLADLGVKVNSVSEGNGQSSIVVDTTSGIVNEALEKGVRQTAGVLSLQPVPVFTYLANAIRANGREVPYSLVTATDLAQLTRDTPQAAPPPADAVVINAWTARELQAGPGDRVELEYFLWDAAAGLQVRKSEFSVWAVVPITGLAADRRLAPEYPGITEAASLADWDPPFPIDLSKIRPQDETYWDEHGTAPKAFIAYDRGRELWQSRYGAVTSLRMPLSPGQEATQLAAGFGSTLRQALPAADMGVAIVPVRAQAIAASAGTTNFGEYFVYFSFFIVVSALLLVVLFFKLGIEQRSRQVGILRASGYTMATIRRMVLSEALLLALIGGALGAVGAVLYATLIIYGLRTWWVGAVGTTLLQVHLSPGPLAAGIAGGVLASFLCVVVSLRSLARIAPRALLHGHVAELDPPTPTQARRRRRIAALCALGGVAMLGWGFARSEAQTGAFFGAGVLLLTAFLVGFSGWLRSRDRRPVTGRGGWAVSRLGFRSASSRPARSVLSAALIASATFVIFSIDAFRRGDEGIVSDRSSGTGGYVLLAQSELPLLHDPNTDAGRDALLLEGPEVARAQVTRFRLRPGQDASCLNLYRPTSPTLIAPAAGFVESNRFTFAASLAEDDRERANPWLLLDRRFDDGAVPAIADATSLQYVLHAKVGDTFEMDIGADAPLMLRFVGALSHSVLQGQVIVGETQFTRLFPARQGYQFFLVDDPSVRTEADATALAGAFERELEEFGVDAVGTSERLAAFHRVENTYLSTFQALGGLGLLLGTVGLAAVMFRNVLERRRELALLRAVGYDRSRISLMIVAEAMLLLVAGLAAGVLCAALAVAPAWLHQGGSRSPAGLLVLLAIVVAAGLISALAATRAAAGGAVLEALRSE